MDVLWCILFFFLSLIVFGNSIVANQTQKQIESCENYCQNYPEECR